MKLFTTLCITSALLVPGFAGAVPKIADFAQNPSFEDVTISPKGDYLAAKVHLKDGFGLAVIRLADHKMTATLSLGLDRDLADYTWVSPTRLVVEPAIYYGTLEAPMRTGELLAVNYDDTDEKYLFGYEGEGQTGTLIRQVGKTYNAAVSIIKSLPDDPEHAIVSLTDFGSGVDTAVSKTCKINVENGLLSSCVSPPGTGLFGFLADNTGAVRYAVSSGDDFQTLETFVRDPGKEEWRRLVRPAGVTHMRTVPIRFSLDNSKVYLSSDEGGDRMCLVELTIATGGRRTLSCDAVGDLGSTVFSFDRNEPIAALYNYDHPRLEYLDTNNHDKMVLQQIEASFPGNLVLPVSTTDDGSTVVLYVYSDRDPGGYYLFDTKTMKVSPLVAIFENILPEDMGERRPISYKARDGLAVHGYLTLPPGRDAKNLPLVMLPHGGPVGPADHWGWDPWAELLATHGYAVLQVNYRGSGGYGLDFHDAGKRAWATGMIDDITDGVHWAVQQGLVDPKRICIFGGSYGGYASLMSAVREPDLYRCAVGYAGVYDLNLQVNGTLFKEKSDTADSTIGNNYIKKYIGSTPEELKAASPITYIDRLKAAVMIVHGTEDRRVPFNQAQALRAALDARHYPYEWLEKSGEGHGFYKPENREDLYTKLLAFLDRNIGPGATAPVATAVGTAVPAQPAAAAPARAAAAGGDAATPASAPAK